MQVFNNGDYDKQLLEGGGAATLLNIYEYLPLLKMFNISLGQKNWVGCHLLPFLELLKMYQK